MYKTAKQIAEEVLSKCDTPGEKIRSKGKGRGLAVGNGEGPRGIPIKEKKTSKQIAEEVLSKCDTPGEQIRSKGMGQGLARGGGRGPMGIPVKEKRAGLPSIRRSDVEEQREQVPFSTILGGMMGGLAGHGLQNIRNKRFLGAPLGLGALLGAGLGAVGGRASGVGYLRKLEEEGEDATKTAGYDFLDAILGDAEKRAGFDPSTPGEQMPEEQPMQAEQSMQQPGQPGQPQQAPVGPYVDPGQAGERRRDEIHQQQLQFANDKHQLELQEMQMNMSHGEQDAQLKSDQARQKAQIQNTKDQELLQLEQQNRQMQQQAAAQQQAAYSQNIGAMGGGGQPPQ